MHIEAIKDDRSQQFFLLGLSIEIQNIIDSLQFIGKTLISLKMKHSRYNDSFNDISFTLPGDTTFQLKPKIVRRRNSELNCSVEKKRKLDGQKTAAAKVVYIPTSKITLTLAQTHQSTISTPVSRENSKENLTTIDKVNNSLRRFQRKTERVFENPKLADKKNIILEEQCKLQNCDEEKAIFKRSIQNLKAKNEKIDRQKTKLQLELEQTKTKLKGMQIDLRQKNIKIQELNSIIDKKETSNKRLHQFLNEKNRQILSLEQTVINLQKQLEISPSLKLGNSSREISETVARLSHQLKYKQIEAHMLKKEKFESMQLQQQIKGLSKQNRLLKERISFIVQRKRQSYFNESSSSSSLQLSLSETSPEKKRANAKKC